MSTSNTLIFNQNCVNEDEMLSAASQILWSRLKRLGAIQSPLDAVEFLKTKLGALEREAFAILFLDNANQIIDYQELFHGTIASASVYPREVIKEVLKQNAANVILAHNHPSGNCEPSAADKAITAKLKHALSLIDVEILDHIIIGNGYVSFAERNLLNPS